MGVTSTFVMPDLYGMLNNSYAQQKADLEKDYQGEQSRALQQLSSRGLSGSTILPSLRLGYARKLSEGKNRLDESYNQQRLQYGMQLSNALLNYMAQQPQGVQRIGPSSSYSPSNQVVGSQEIGQNWYPGSYMSVYGQYR